MTEKFTAGDLRRALSGISDDTEISFAGGLTFYRFKRWADNEFVLEFGEAEAATSERFRREHPSILVSFCKPGRFDEL